MVWWLAFENKPFQFWREIWIQVVVILLQLYIQLERKKCIKINFPEIIHQIEVCKFQEFSAYSKALEICLYKYVCTYILPTMSNNVPTRILYSAHKICGKKHAIGYIHKLLFWTWRIRLFQFPLISFKPCYFFYFYKFISWYRN